MRLLTVVSLIVLGCSDDPPNQASPLDASPIVVVDALMPDASPDYVFIVPQDAAVSDQFIEPCNTVTNLDHERYCTCHPECCSTQEWYCPPSGGTEISSMQVIIDICGDQQEPCEFGVDPECPPPSIIYRSECVITHNCPPGSSRDFLRWFECQLDDGRQGRQRVLCDKGSIVHGPCTDCEGS